MDGFHDRRRRGKFRQRNPDVRSSDDTVCPDESEIVLGRRRKHALLEFQNPNIESRLQYGRPTPLDLCRLGEFFRIRGALFEFEGCFRHGPGHANDSRASMAHGRFPFFHGNGSDVLRAENLHGLPSRLFSENSTDGLPTSACQEGGIQVALRLMGGSLVSNSDSSTSSVRSVAPSWRWTSCPARRPSCSANSGSSRQRRTNCSISC